MTKAEILRALQDVTDKVCNHMQALTDAQAAIQPNGKWSANQHLDHLIVALDLLQKALRKPKLALRFAVGKPNRPGRNYDQVVARYHERLAAKDVSNNPFAAEVLKTQRPELLANYKSAHGKFLKALLKWNEKQLDKYLLPHPLLGKVTVREMLYFVIYHTGHHLEIMERPLPNT